VWRIRVFDIDIVLWYLSHVVPDDLCQSLAVLFCSLSIPCPRPFHLVEDGVVTPINGISSEHICGDEVPLSLVRAEGIGLMGGRVRP